MLAILSRPQCVKRRIDCGYFYISYWVQFGADTWSPGESKVTSHLLTSPPVMSQNTGMKRTCSITRTGRMMTKLMARSQKKSHLLTSSTQRNPKMNRSPVSLHSLQHTAYVIRYTYDLLYLVSVIMVIQWICTLLSHILQTYDRLNKCQWSDLGDIIWLNASNHKPQQNRKMCKFLRTRRMIKCMARFNSGGLTKALKYN